MNGEGRTGWKLDGAVRSEAKTQAPRMHPRTGPAGQPPRGEKQRLWRKTNTDSNLSSTTRCCATLAKLHNLSGPQHPEPKIGNSFPAFLSGLLWGCKERAQGTGERPIAKSRSVEQSLQEESRGSKPHPETFQLCELCKPHTLS